MPGQQPGMCHQENLIAKNRRIATGWLLEAWFVVVCDDMINNNKNDDDWLEMNETAGCDDICDRIFWNLKHRNSIVTSVKINLYLFKMKSKFWMEFRRKKRNFK